MESILKNRIELAKHFNTLGFKVGAEVGVYAGYYSEALCQEIPNLTLYAIDPWESHAKIQEAYAQAIARLAPYNCTLLKKTSLEASKDFKDESLDFVFIDGRHTYEAVKEDLELWTPKVRKGGIISGHDYYEGKSGTMGVIKAVDEFIALHNFKLKLTDWDKRNPNKDNWQPCFYFTK